MKLDQFLKLQQGEQSVLEYLSQFNHLSQYAPEYVSMDVAKKGWFVRGLHTKLQAMLTTCTNASYNEIVSIAISFEDKYNQHKEAKKRKEVLVESSGGNAQCHRIIHQPVHHSFYYLPQ